MKTRHVSAWTSRITHVSCIFSPYCGSEPLRRFLQTWPAAALPWSAPCCRVALRPQQQEEHCDRTAEGAEGGGPAGGRDDGRLGF